MSVTKVNYSVLFLNHFRPRKHLNCAQIEKFCRSSGGVVRSSILPFRGSDRGFKFFQETGYIFHSNFEELKIPPGASTAFSVLLPEGDIFS